jgi:hypothetical protein
MELGDAMSRREELDTVLHNSDCVGWQLVLCNYH